MLKRRPCIFFEMSLGGENRKLLRCCRNRTSALSLSHFNLSYTYNFNRYIPHVNKDVFQDFKDRSNANKILCVRTSRYFDLNLPRSLNDTIRCFAMLSLCDVGVIKIVPLTTLKRKFVQGTRAGFRSGVFEERFDEIDEMFLDSVRTVDITGGNNVSLWSSSDGDKKSIRFDGHAVRFIVHRKYVHTIMYLEFHGSKYIFELENRYDAHVLSKPKVALGRLNGEISKTIKFNAKAKNTDDMHLSMENVQRGSASRRTVGMDCGWNRSVEIAVCDESSDNNDAASFQYVTYEGKQNVTRGKFARMSGATSFESHIRAAVKSRQRVKLAQERLSENSIHTPVRFREFEHAFRLRFCDSVFEPLHGMYVHFSLTTTTTKLTQNIRIVSGTTLQSMRIFARLTNRELNRRLQSWLIV